MSFSASALHVTEMWDPKAKGPAALFVVAKVLLIYSPSQKEENDVEAVNSLVVDDHEASGAPILLRGTRLK